MADPQGADPHRLPRTVVPSRYDLVLEPDLDAGTFRGTVAASVDVVDPVAELVLNAIELVIDEAWVVDANGTRSDASVSYDEATERATLSFDAALVTGTATVHASFRGILNDKLHGFYRSTFTDATGTTRTLATTQFESTDARRAFPCWDEPDFKAIFGVTLVVPADLLALSNGAEIGREDTGDGRVRVRFADTMVMSTYLVAFVVGPLEATDPVDVDGVPLRVVHPLGKADLAGFALDIGASALRYFADYYGIGYPGGKVDLVAIPDFAFGAMENLGCITFRETALLVDPARATQPELERVADVVAHELAHMWFGDLVTMKWWNGIWLNEAFATFMETLAVDHFRPDWDRWTTFALSRSAAYDTDSLAATRPIEFEVVSPADAEGMFDVLTYEKGASVVRMLEQYLGEADFRTGIRAYLAQHAYGNTETTDLWDALEAATGQPVRRIADTWIFQGGHPVIGVDLAAEGTVLRLTQEQFRYLGGDAGARWAVPVLVRWADTSTGDVHERKELLDGDALEIDLPTAASWVVANSGASGFYRVRYTPELRAAVTARAQGSLNPAERYALVDDTWASVLAGTTSAREFLELAAAFGDEPDVSVWRRLIGALATLDRISDDATRDRLAAFIGTLLSPALDRLGPAPLADEPERVTVLRAALFEALGVLAHDERVLERSRRILAGEVDVDPATADAAVRVVAGHADAATFDDFLARSKAATTPQDTLRYLGALADVDDPALFSRFLDLLLGPDVRTQDAGLLLNRALTNRANAATAWAFATSHWDELIERLPTNAVSRMITGVRTFHDAALATRVEAFLEAHPVPQAARAFAQHLERMRVTVELAGREQARLGDALS